MNAFYYNVRCCFILTVANYFHQLIKLNSLTHEWLRKNFFSRSVQMCQFSHSIYINANCNLHGSYILDYRGCWCVFTHRLFRFFRVQIFMSFHL